MMASQPQADATQTVIDAHFHSWQLARGDYGWLTPALPAIYRDVSVSDWWEQARAHGVAGGVLVQAAATEAETSHLLALATAHPQVLGVVGWVDWLAEDAPQRIAQLARQPKLKGLRPMLQDIADPDWILQAALTPCLQAMAEHDLVFDALVKPVHLPRLHTLAQRHPSLRVVIDHCAKPDIAHGQWQPWADDLATLARNTRWYCKLSGLLTECAAAPPADAARRWARNVLDCFGPDRLLWGSDWPVLQLAGPYDAWWQETHAVLADLPAQQQHAVLGGNARRAYQLA